MRHLIRANKSWGGPSLIVESPIGQQMPRLRFGIFDKNQKQPGAKRHGHVSANHTSAPTAIIGGIRRKRGISSHFPLEDQVL